RAFVDSRADRFERFGQGGAAAAAPQRIDGLVEWHSGAQQGRHLAQRLRQLAGAYAAAKRPAPAAGVALDLGYAGREDVALAQPRACGARAVGFDEAADAAARTGDAAVA